MPNPKIVPARTTPAATATFFILPPPFPNFYRQFQSTLASSDCNQEDGWFYKRQKVDRKVNLSTDAPLILI
jgi:hypothetical protein